MKKPDVEWGCRQAELVLYPIIHPTSMLIVVGSIYKVVRSPGFEPGTPCLEGRCSIQLSYDRMRITIYYYTKKSTTEVFCEWVVYTFLTYVIHIWLVYITATEEEFVLEFNQDGSF